MTAPRARLESLADDADDAGDAQTTLLTAPRGDSIATLRTRPRLRWRDAQGEHEVIVEGRTMIGSADRADIALQDAAVSRIHAELDPRPDGLWLRDLGSRNGTFVNDVLIASARVPDGGRVRVGSTTFWVISVNETVPVEISQGERFGPLAGRSPIMRELFARLAKLAATDASVLIHGETGTGKELAARALHDASPRAHGPFVIVDCAALPEQLLEAELFGHAKGAFTGAVSSRQGAIESAEGGTVFLDEVGELPMPMQPKLLRVLESRTVRPIGTTAQRPVDVRFLSATHRDLRRMVNAGAFREDLYFRLAVLPVSIPPLRERVEDIPLLIDHFLPAGAKDAFSPEVCRELSERPWLGNVRELRNFVERALALGPVEALAMASERGSALAEAGQDGVQVRVMSDRPIREAREAWVEQLEREYVIRLLDRHRRNIPEAASAAGVDRTYLYRLLRKHQL